MGAGNLRQLMGLFLSYRRGEETPQRPLPRQLWVEPTNACNLRCSMCLNRKLKKEEKGYMELPLFQKIIEECRGYVVNINLHHRGESLLHPELGEMVRLAHGAGMRSSIHTNATLLDEEKSGALVSAGLDALSFSFDGFEAETYERIRKGANFEKTLENIVRFLQVKKRMGKKNPETTLELIDFSRPGMGPRKKREVPEEFAAHFRGLPLDNFIVKGVHNWAGNFPLDADPGEESRGRGAPTGRPDGGKGQGSESAGAQAEGSSLAAGKAGKTGEAAGGAGKAQQAAGQEVEDTIPVRIRSHCTFPWFALTIFWDGTVVPCPQDFFGVYPVGNVKDGDLREIWQGERMRELRRRMVAKDVKGLGVCPQCDQMQRKTILGVPRPFLWKFLRSSV